MLAGKGRAGLRLMRAEAEGRPLLCATTSYPVDSAGAEGRFVALLNDQYARQGWAPHVLCPVGSSPRRGRCPVFGYRVREVASIGPIFRSGGAPDWLQRHPIKALLSAPPSALSLIMGGRALEQSAPSAARVAHWLIPSALCFSRAHLAHAHGGDVALLESLPLGARLAQWIEQRVSGLNFVSQDLKSRYEALLGRALRVPSSCLPMGVERPRPCDHEQARLRALKADKLMICTVGRLTEIKGHMTLLKALARMSDEQKSSLLWVAAGSGPLEAQLRSEATRERVPLLLVGQLAPPARDALLRCADLFVLPSLKLGERAEGSPVALMEALSSGCPVLATRAGGVSGLIQPSTLTALCEPGDSEALTARVTELIQVIRSLEPESLAKHRAQLERQGRQWRWETLGPQHARALQEAYTG